MENQKKSLICFKQVQRAFWNFTWSIIGSGAQGSDDGVAAVEVRSVFVFSFVFKVCTRVSTKPVKNPFREVEKGYLHKAISQPMTRKRREEFRVLESFVGREKAIELFCQKLVFFSISMKTFGL